jgi:hypothetical protein
VTREAAFLARGGVGVIGSSERDLVRDWGPPNRTHDFAGGGRQLFYSKQFRSSNTRSTSYCNGTFQVDHAGIIRTASGAFPNLACVRGTPH